MFGRKRETLKGAAGPTDECNAATARGEYQPIIGPLDDLCRDIRENPRDYAYDNFIIRAKADDNLWIYGNGPYSWSCFGPPTVAEIKVMEEACRQFADYASEIRTHDLAARLAKLKFSRTQEPVAVRNAKAIIDVCRGIEGSAARAVSSLAEQMLPVLEGTHKIVPVNDFNDGLELKHWASKPGRTTIETVTPGDDRPVMRDFDASHNYGGDGHAIRKPDRWLAKDGTWHRTRREQRIADRMHALTHTFVDDDGKPHTTPAHRAAANIAIEAKPRKRKAGVL